MKYAQPLGCGDLNTLENVAQSVFTAFSLPEMCMLGNSKQPNKALLLNRKHDTKNKSVKGADGSRAGTVSTTQKINIRQFHKTPSEAQCQSA